MLVFFPLSELLASFSSFRKTTGLRDRHEAYLPVCLLQFQLLNLFTTFRVTWYECYATGSILIVVRLISGAEILYGISL